MLVTKLLKIIDKSHNNTNKQIILVDLKLSILANLLSNLSLLF